MMAKIRTIILLVGLVALCAVSIASPLGKVADSSSEELDSTNKMMKELMEMRMNNLDADAAYLSLMESLQGSSPLGKVADSSWEELDRTNEMMKGLAEMCKNNSGSDAAFLNLMESAQNTMMCAISAIDLDSLMQDAENLSNETRTTFFPRYCPQLRSAYSCIDKFVTDFRPCLEADDYVIVRALSGILPDAVELMCKNDGEILFKFDEPKYSECFDKISDSFDECLTFLNGTDTDDWDISHLSRDQCGQLTGFRECLKSKMDICKASDLISVYDLFHNTLFRITPCRNYAETEKVIQVINYNDLNAV